MLARPARLTATIAATVVAVLAVTPVAEAATRKPSPRPAPAPITAAFFGMHQARIGDVEAPAPASGVGSFRLWDTGTAWRDIETAPRVYDFSRLDRAVSRARAAGAKPMLVLGQTPSWYSSRPREASYYGPGAAAMPKNLPAFRAYVRAVALRYKGRIDAYEVWNEPSAGFFSGTPAQMLTLTKEVRLTVKSADPRALVVAPSSPARRPGQRSWINAYYATGAGRYVDVVNVHLYPAPGGTPESSMGVLADVRAILARYKVNKPVWNTELNYGLPYGGAGRAARQFADSTAAAYVARTYLLNAAAGIGRVHWYSWTNTNIFGINLTRPDGTTTAAAKAYDVTRGWMVGARVLGCATDKVGVYTCTLKYARGSGKVMWASKRATTNRTPAYTTAIKYLDGRVVKSAAGKRVVLGPQPVLIQTSR